MKSTLRFVLVAFLLALAASVPASAQIQLSGVWNPRTHEDQLDRGPGPDLGDYTGLPINDAARLFAESWDASRLTLQEHQCRVHVAPYIYHGPLRLRIWEEKDPETQQVIAIKNYISTYEQTRTIWMDGRPHPSPFAPHTFMGFSTGAWEGDVLTVTTTHLKQGWLRRNGVPESDQTTMVEHFIRHGQYLTHLAIISDPVYLAEPMIRSTDFQIAVEDNGPWLWPCEYVEEIAGKSKVAVPHYQPGQNPFIKEYLAASHVPATSASGGPETTYPDYESQLKGLRTPPLSVAASPRVSQVPNPDTGQLQLLRVQGNVHLLAGAGGNVVVQVGESGSLLVDSKSAAVAQRILDEVKRVAVSPKPVRYVLNTSADADHIGGNQNLAAALGSAASWEIINTPGATNSAVQIIAHDNVLKRMSKMPITAQPTETFVGREKEFFFNGEPVFMYHVPAAHTDGDSIVFFRKSDVISAGDLFVTNGYPFIDLNAGGNVQGIVAGLNKIVELCIPVYGQEGGTMVIPGHGRLSDVGDVINFREMVTIVRDRVQDMVKKNMTLEQVKAAKPTRDYDPLYNTPGAFVTGDAFTEAVYRSLKK